MMWWYGYGWGPMLLMLLSMLFWVAVIALVVWALIRWAGPRAPGGGTSPSGPAGPSAMEILRQRYARGEIDTATFDHMRERLEGGGTHTGEPLAGQ
jgi:putative membrane protein